ncbi:MAG: isochorismatase family protein [Polyangiaceae bacterium]|nr:isochorismatase family protein [Polyangiaceae bacterium]
MTALPRVKPSRTVLVVVDIQERLAVAMPPEQLAAVERATRILLGAATELGAPVLATEQYPKGLGPTVPALRALLEPSGARPIEKLAFSACGEPRFASALDELTVEAAVVVGMETHVCVFQTVRDLVARGLEVSVPLDGVASRRDDHRTAGLRLCEKAGATVTTAETLLFDWLGQAGTDAFKKLSKLVR